jgi:hypothetical protein
MGADEEPESTAAKDLGNGEEAGEQEAEMDDDTRRRGGGWRDESQ